MVQVFNINKILVVGSGGMLGSVFSNKVNNYNFILTSKLGNDNTIKLDITNSNNVKEVLKHYNPNIIINCAAYTNVDQSEIYKNNAHNVNVNGVRNLIKYSHKNTKIVHISSDYVYKGDKKEYFENTIPSPINYYGKTKLEADNILLSSNRNCIILRINGLFTNDCNFNNFYTWVYNSLSKNIKINVVDDQISNPTYVNDLYEIIMESILLDVDGLFHYGTANSISRYEFALKIAKYNNLNNRLIKKIKTENFKQIAKRPLKTFLNCDKIINAIDTELHTVENIIHKYIKQ